METNKMEVEIKDDELKVTLDEDDEEEYVEVKKDVTEDDFGDFTVTKHEDMKLITIRGKNLQFLSARRKISNIVRKASFNKGYNEVNKTKFKVTNYKSLMYSNECDVEISDKGEKGKAKLTLYKDNKKKEGKKDQTIMVTKLAKHDAKNVKTLTENVIQYLLVGFLTKTISESIVEVKDVKEEKQSVMTCDKCDRNFVSIPGLKTHMTRMHGEKTEVKKDWFSCDKCEGRFKLEGALVNHKNEKHTKAKKTEEKTEEENMKRIHSVSPKTERKRTKSEVTRPNDLEEDLRLAREEIRLMKEEKVKSKKTEKEQNEKYVELKKENGKIIEDLAKVQSERDLLKTKVKTLEERTKREETNVVVEDNEEVEEFEDALMDIQEESEDEVDEVADALNLLEMKESGGNAGRAFKGKTFKCETCGNQYGTKQGMVKHKMTFHKSFCAPCPFCQTGFSSLADLENHIKAQHKETPKEDNTNKVNKKKCDFFWLPRGCKKGDACTHSHEGSIEDVKKVRKLCRNGQRCTWRPRCRYVHPEDGEVIPPREERGSSGSSGSRGQGRLHYSPSNGWIRVPDQGFLLDYTRPPPGYQVKEVQGSTRVQVVPDVRNMQEFPGAPEPKHITRIQINAD